jgi:hypothetical protein
MGSVGDAYDNAMAESFFATLERELLDRTRFETQATGAARDLRLDRGLVQPGAASLVDRVPIAERVRATPRAVRRTRGCAPNPDESEMLRAQEGLVLESAQPSTQPR